MADDFWLLAYAVAACVLFYVLALVWLKHFKRLQAVDLVVCATVAAAWPLFGVAVLLIWIGHSARRRAAARGQA